MERVLQNVHDFDYSSIIVYWFHLTNILFSAIPARFQQQESGENKMGTIRKYTAAELESN